MAGAWDIESGRKWGKRKEKPPMKDLVSHSCKQIRYINTPQTLCSRRRCELIYYLLDCYVLPLP